MKIARLTKLLIPIALLSLIPFDLQAQSKKPLYLAKAAFNGELRLAKRLLDEGVDPNLRVGPHDNAAFSGSDGGYPLGSQSWTPLMALAASETIPETQFMIADALLEKGAKLDERDAYGASALNIAINNRNIEFALYLLEKKCNPNGAVGIYIDNVGGQTALHNAVGHPILVKVLLEAGADATVKDDEGKTAVDLARDFGYTKSLQLLEKGVRSN
jgi:ankyrin repeat protein